APKARRRRSARPTSSRHGWCSSICTSRCRCCARCAAGSVRAAGSSARCPTPARSNGACSARTGTRSTCRAASITSRRARSARCIDAALFDPSEAPPAVLVLAKRYDATTLATALALHQRAGTRIALDLSDNHFFFGAPDERLQRRADALREAVGAVDLVVTAS